MKRRSATRSTHTRGWVSALTMTAMLASSLRAHAVPRVASRDVRPSAWLPRTARYLVAVGNFTAGTDASAQRLCALARTALVGRLTGDTSVMIRDGAGDGRDRGVVEQMLRRYHLRGFVIDGHVRVVNVASASRVEVSLVVQTNPGREYRFESSVSVTLSGGDAEQRDAVIEAATRRAVLAATTRAIGQLASG